jgi:ABC-type multidrug transport system fused ATPase/permease subunit
MEHLIATLLLEESDYQASATQLATMLWSRLDKKYRWLLAGGIGATFIAGSLLMVFPLTIRYLIDDVLVTKTVSHAQRQQGIVLFTGLYGGIWLLSLGGQWLRDYWLRRTGQQLLFAIRRDLYRKVNRLTQSFLDTTSPGRLMSRLLDDVEVAGELVTHGSVDILSGIARLIAGSVTIMIIDWRLGGLVLLTLPLYGALFAWLRPVMRRGRTAFRRLSAMFYGYAAERVGGWELIKNCGAEKKERLRFVSYVNNQVRLADYVVSHNALLTMMASSVIAITTVVLLGALVHSLHQGHLSSGALIAFYSAMLALFEPLASLVNNITHLQDVSVVLRRIHTLLQEPEVAPGSCSCSLNSTHSLRCVKVSFSYDKSHRRVVDEVSFEIKRGERIALMGPSGSGKSTLLRLLMGSYSPVNGRIELGTCDMQQCSPASLSSCLGLVAQQPIVLSGTIEEAITYGVGPCAEGRVRHAATLARLDSFIQSLPLGYQTPLGERGITLSGGQRQRLALAALLLRTPAFLLLDDVTSALDARTEGLIIDTLFTQLPQSALLLVTQRLSLASRCDSILILDEGRVVSWGDHSQLMNTSPYYQRLAELQNWTAEPQATNICAGRIQF